MKARKIRVHIVVPRDLWADVRVIAAEENRSISGQVVHWLQFMVSQRKSRWPHWWQTGYEYDGSWMYDMTEEE